MHIMLSKAKTMIGYKLHSLTGEVGKVTSFYFDDHHWTIRYLVVDTGTWMSGRHVLISPYALTTVNKMEQNIAVNLTKRQIEDSPSSNTDKPVSRQFEESYNGYYGLPMYWNGPFVWGAYPSIERNRVKPTELNAGGKPWDYHLRSTAVVNGYNIEASDGEIGHVEDFIIDEETWEIRYIIVDTRNWLPGKKVLISPQWIEQVSWDLSKVFVNLSRETIKLSPEYGDSSSVTRDYENELHGYYNLQGYWVEGKPPKTNSH